MNTNQSTMSKDEASASNSNSQPIEKQVKFKLLQDHSYTSRSFADGRPRNAKGQFGKDVKSEMGVTPSFSYATDLQIGQYKLGKVALEIGTSGISGVIDIKGDPLERYDVNQSLKSLLEKSRDVPDVISPEILKNIESSLQFLQIDSSKVNLKTISIEGPSLSVGGGLSETVVGLKAGVQVAAIKLSLDTPVGAVDIRIREGASLGAKVQNTETKSGKPGTKTTKTVSIGMFEMSWTPADPLNVAGSSVEHAAYAELQGSVDTDVKSDIQLENTIVKGAQAAQERAENFVNKHKPGKSSKKSTHKAKSGKSHENKSSTSNGLSQQEECAILDQVVEQVSESALRYSPRDATINQQVREYHQEKTAGRHATAYSSFMIKLSEHLEHEKCLNAVVACGREGGVFLSQVANLTGERDVAKFATALSGVTQAFSGMRTFSNEMKNFSDSASAVSSLQAGATSMGTLLSMAGLMSGAGMILGGISLVSSLFADDEENRLGEALEAIHTAIMGMWSEMRESFEFTWEKLDVIENKLDLMEINNAKRFKCMVELISQSYSVLLLQMASSKSQQIFFYQRIEEYLKNITDHEAQSVILNIQKSTSEDLRDIKTFRQYTTALSLWLQKTARLGSGYIKTVGDNPIEDTTLIRELVEFLSINSTDNPTNAPLGLLSQLAQPYLETGSAQEYNPKKYINPQQWFDVLNVYLLLIENGRELIINIEDSVHKAYMDEIRRCWSVANDTLNLFESMVNSERLWQSLVENYQRHFSEMKAEIDGQKIIECADIPTVFQLNAIESVDENFTRVAGADFNQFKNDTVDAITWRDNSYGCLSTSKTRPEFSLQLCELAKRNDFVYLIRYGVMSPSSKENIHEYKRGFSLIRRVINFQLGMEIDSLHVCLSHIYEKRVRHNNEREQFSYSPCPDLIDYLTQSGSGKLFENVIVPRRAQIWEALKKAERWLNRMNRLHRDFLALMAFIKLIDPSFQFTVSTRAIDALANAPDLVVLYQDGLHGKLRDGGLRSDFWQEPLWDYMGNNLVNFTVADLQEKLKESLDDNPIYMKMQSAKEGLETLIDKLDKNALQQQLRVAQETDRQCLLEQQTTIDDALVDTINACDIISVPASVGDKKQLAVMKSKLISASQAAAQGFYKAELPRELAIHEPCEPNQTRVRISLTARPTPKSVDYDPTEYVHLSSLQQFCADPQADLQILIENGAEWLQAFYNTHDPEAPLMPELYPLHLSLKNGRKDIVNYLLENDMNIRPDTLKYISTDLDEHTRGALIGLLTLYRHMQQQYIDMLSIHTSDVDEKFSLGKIFSLLRGAMNELNQYRDLQSGAVHILLGETGTGKSTFFNCLLDVEYLYKGIREGLKASTSEYSPSSSDINSSTIYPIIRQLPDGDFIMDTPGLNDNRGEAYNIACGAGIRAVANIFKTVASLNVFTNASDYKKPRLTGLIEPLQTLADIIADKPDLLKIVRIVVNFASSEYTNDFIIEKLKGMLQLKNLSPNLRRLLENLSQIQVICVERPTPEFKTEFLKKSAEASGAPISAFDFSHFHKDTEKFQRFLQRLDEYYRSIKARVEGLRGLIYRDQSSLLAKAYEALDELQTQLSSSLVRGTEDMQQQKHDLLAAMSAQVALRDTLMQSITSLQNYIAKEESKLAIDEGAQSMTLPIRELKECQAVITELETLFSTLEPVLKSIQFDFAYCANSQETEENSFFTSENANANFNADADASSDASKPGIGRLFNTCAVFTRNTPKVQQYGSFFSPLSLSVRQSHLSLGQKNLFP